MVSPGSVDIQETSRSLTHDTVDLEPGRADCLAVAGSLEQPRVVLVASRLGAVGEHHRPPVDHPVNAPEPRVIQDPLVAEVKQPTFVDRTSQDRKQGSFERQNLHPFVSCWPLAANPLTPRQPP